MKWGAGLVAFALVAVALACGSAAAVAGEKVDNSLPGITKRLASAQVTLQVDKQAPDQALDVLREQANVNIVVTPDARAHWAEQTITLKLKAVSGLSALQHVLRQLDVVATYADEALVIETPKAAQPHPQISIYDIRDITEIARSTRVPPQLFGAQIDPLYYYWTRTQLGPVAGTGVARDPFYELELLDRYPPDPIGEIIAQTIQNAVEARKLDISVSYHDGYLVVVEHPKAPRVPAAE